MAAETVDIGTGITINFATSSFDAEILTLEGPEFSRPIIDTSHQGTTGGRTKQGGDIPDWGDVTISGHFNPDDDPGALFPASGEVITITWPSTGTWVFQGIVANYRPGPAFEDKITFDMTLAVDGDVAVTGA